MAPLSSNNENQRIMDAARTPDWSFGLDRYGQIMATRDSGDIGHPWVVVARRSGKGLRLSRFRPGDDIEAEGEDIGDIAGNPREMGRQLRDLLSDLELTE